MQNRISTLLCFKFFCFPWEGHFSVKAIPPSLDRVESCAILITQSFVNHVPSNLRSLVTNKSPAHCGDWLSLCMNIMATHYQHSCRLWLSTKPMNAPWLGCGINSWAIYACIHPNRQLLLFNMTLKISTTRLTNHPLYAAAETVLLFSGALNEASCG